MQRDPARACRVCFMQGDSRVETVGEQCHECRRWLVQIDDCGPPFGAVKVMSRSKP